MFFIISGIAGNTTDALNAASLADATASLYQETIKTCFSTQDLKSEEIGLPSCVEHKLTQSYYLNNRGKLTVARVLSCFAYNQPDIQYCPMLYPIASILRHYLSGTNEAIIDLHIFYLELTVRGHSTTTWTEFCHILTPTPLPAWTVFIPWTNWTKTDIF